MEIFKTRAEHDFYKMLALLLSKLPTSEQKKEIIALVDGYFITSRERTRKKDIQVSLLIQEKEEEKCLTLSLSQSDLSLVD